MSFKDNLMSDLADSFFNENEFGESVTLLRGGVSYSVKGLYDSPEVASESIGDVNAIAHAPRLFVSIDDLPERKARKNDVFVLELTPLHSAMKLRAVDFVCENDGVVVYRLIVYSDYEMLQIFCTDEGKSGAILIDERNDVTCLVDE